MQTPADISGPFHFDPPRRLLICTVCHVGVNPKSIDKHISEYHKTIKKPEREMISRHWHDVAARAPDDPGEEEAMALGYHPLLRVMAGWRCPIEGCGYSVAIERSFTSHHIEKSHPQVVRPYPDRVACQVSFFWNRPKRYFPVTPPAPEAVPPLGPHLDDVLQGYEQKLQQLQRDRTVIKSSSSQHRNLWALRTGWPEWFDGLDVAPLVDLTTLEPRAADDFHFPTLREHVDQLLRRCYDRLRLGETALSDDPGTDRPANGLARRIIYSTTEENSTQLLGPVQLSSMENYGRIWLSFTVFLIRASQWTTEQRRKNRLILSEKQQEHLSTVHSLFSPSPSDTTSFIHREGALMSLYRSVIEQDLDQHERQSPLLYYLALRGFNLHTHTWRTAEQHSSSLSAVIYDVRLICLHHVLSSSSDGQIISDLRRYTSLYLHIGQPYVFDEIYSQRHYAMEVGRHFYRQPNIVWNSDGRSLVYSGSDVDLNGLRAWVQSLIREARRILCEQLLFVEEDYLDQFNPQNLRDNLTWANTGHSLIDHNPILSNRLRTIIHRTQGQKCCVWSDVWERPQEEAFLVLQNFQETFHLFLTHLAAIHLFMTSRTTELFSHQWCNTQNALRSWFVVDGQFCTITLYNKTQSCAGKPRVIPRYFPHEVGKLFVAHLAEVLPLYDLLRHHAGVNVRATNTSLVWHRDDRAWNSTDITPFLHVGSEHHIGWRIGARDLRQILIAWRQRYCDTGEDETEGFGEHDHISDAGALQAGHSAQLESRHYAVSADMLQGTSNETLTIFRHSSHRMHLLLGIADTPTAEDPRSSLKRSASAPPFDLPLRRNRKLGHNGRSNLYSSSTSTPMMGDVEVRAAVHDEIQQLKQWLTPQLERHRCRCDSSTLTSAASSGSSTPEEGHDGLQLEVPAHPWPEVMKVFRHRYGSTAQFRSQGQHNALWKMTQSSTVRDLVVRLPTGGGKTLLIEMSAALEPMKVTVVIVPYKSLQADLLKRLRDRGIDAHILSTQHDPIEVSVVLVVMETVLSDTYRGFITCLEEKGRLARVFWDEAHLIVTESQRDFRRWADAVKFQRPGVRRVFLSATLPEEVRERLYLLAQVKSNEVVLVEETSNVPAMTWDVALIGEDDDERRLQEEVSAVRGAVLIYVQRIADGERLHRLFEWPFYHSQVLNGAQMLNNFREGQFRVLVGTTGVSHGLDVSVELVVIYGGGFDLINVAQQAGRLCRVPGAPGRCLLLTPLWILDNSQPSDSLGRAALMELLKTETCRRAVVVSYLDNRVANPCQVNEAPCDLCRTRARPLRSAHRDETSSNLSWAFDYTPASEPNRPAALSTVRESVTETNDKDLIRTSEPSPISATCLTSMRDSSRVRTMLYQQQSQVYHQRPSLTQKICQSTVADTILVPRSSPPSILTVSSDSHLPAFPGPSSARDTSFSSTTASLMPSTPAMERGNIRVQLRQAIDRLAADTVQCIRCWLSHRPDYTAHLHGLCPHWAYAATREKDFKLTTKRRLRDLEYGNKRIHLNCVLPLDECHPRSQFPFSKDCEGVGLLYHALESGLSSPRYRDLLARQFRLTSDLPVVDLVERVVVWQGDTRTGFELQLWKVFLDLVAARYRDSGRS